MQQNPAGPTVAELARFLGDRAVVNIDSSNATDVITGITVNSRKIIPGMAFAALPGSSVHGIEFAREAIANGASLIFTDAFGADTLKNIDKPVFQVSDARAMLGEVAAFCYGNTSENLPKLFAITGTNGKTSTAYILHAILRQLGEKVALSTTAARLIGDQEIPSDLTTPEASELHELLFRMRQAQVSAAVIEVSAQALTRQRVAGVKFDVAGFTNLSHDHLDDYRDMPTYLAAKALLFTEQYSRGAAVSLDTEYGKQLATQISIPFETVSSQETVASAESSGWTYRSLDVELQNRVPLQKFQLASPSGDVISSSITAIGDHMVSNAALAIAMLVQSGVELAAIRDALKSGIKVSLPGRLEQVNLHRGPLVFLDFGHSPDAFEKSLTALRKITSGKLIMVFGASGDRDHTKRPAMGRITATLADVIVVTDHHSRSENPAEIRSELLEHARAAGSNAEILEVSPPEAAIRAAIGLAGASDTVLWAGPGHLDYREVAGVKQKLMARDEIAAALKQSGWS